MGGGDLNLKKSWHPQTMKNIERVWKAEQKHEAERKKIEELQKELKDERAREEITKFAQETGALKKKDDRLDWMYQGPGGQVSRDEYLLGRPIDKQITEQYEEQESGPSAQTGLLPGSIFNPSTTASNLDLAAKIREDPLFEIRKREEEKKREVLTNPVKMKKIKEMLRLNLENKKDKKKKRKKEKKEKREKERRKEKKHRRSSSSDQEEKKHKSSREDSSGTRSRSHHIPGYGLLHPVSRHHQGPAPPHHQGPAPPHHQGPAPPHHQGPAPPHHSRSRSQERSQSRSPHRTDRDDHHSSDKKLQRKAPSPQRSHHHRQQSNHGSKRLSAEELEKKRQQMMEFAKQREEERENNVRAYRRQDEQEKKREEAGKHGRSAGFIHNMKLESAATSSVEDRVKRNIHSIQRTTASLEKNFMRR